jgi:hypothetical protein
MTLTHGYWRAYFRFVVPLMAILVTLDYLQRNRGSQMGSYPWLQRLLFGLAISFIVPPIYLGAVKVWGRVRH